MKIDIPYESFERLKELLEILDTAKLAHDTPEGTLTTNMLMDDDSLIDPWSPSDWMDAEGFKVEIQCPGLTVGVLRMASKLKANLKL